MQQGMRRSTSSGLMARDMSPNSVIQTGGSNVSSTSGSAERCYLASEVSHELTGKECLEASSRGQDLETKKVINILGHKGSHVSRQGKVKVEKLIGQAETVDELLYLDSARSSFSQALKECQDKRLRSEALSKKEERRSVMASQLGVFPSPGTPNYRHSSVGAQKGWSSERVPLNTNANRRDVNTALLSYNNGRALPSKWEHAERWILSPVMGDCNQRSSFQQQQPKPKSKSGPLGPPGIAYHSMYSPAVPMFDRGSVGHVVMNSQLSADDMPTKHSEYPRIGNPIMRPEPSIARSVSLHGPGPQSSLPGPLGKVDDTRDAATDVSRTASRRDMATQMSPEGTPSSSPGRRSSCSALTSPILPVVEFPSSQLPRSEIRDVQVDEGVTVTRWSKKNKARILGKGSGNDHHCKKKGIEFRSSSWGNSEASKSISKVQREEAKIIAWENLQKAKAEAAIRKLEMKLEKKRSSSIDKIMNKLRSAQKKAQQMRSSVMANESQQVSKTSSSKDLSFRRTHQMGSLSGCFTCPAF